MQTNTYIGARYVPVYGGTYDEKKCYENLVMVDYTIDGVTGIYISATFVPAGVTPADAKYWIEFKFYLKQVAELAQQVLDMQEIVDKSAADSETARRTAAEANATANAANEKSDQAVATANAANQKSDQAVATANAANEKSDQAVATANAANEKSDQAVATAGHAEAKADAAVATSQSALETASAAVNTAEEALEIAHRADDNATEAMHVAGEALDNSKAAVDTSNQANAKADNANTIAGNAATSAAQAVTEAHRAEEAASDSQAAAEAAQAAAEAAQQAAENAEESAETAKNAAVEVSSRAVEIADSADKKADLALSNSEAAKSEAGEASARANAAKDAAETASASAATSASTAEAAQRGAEAARAEAEAAKEASQTSQNAAEEARDYAETASAAATNAVNEIREEVTVVKEDVSTLQSEMVTVKEKVNDLEPRVEQLEIDAVALQTNVNTIDKREMQHYMDLYNRVYNSDNPQNLTARVDKLNSDVYAAQNSADDAMSKARSVETSVTNLSTDVTKNLMELRNYETTTDKSIRDLASFDSHFRALRLLFASTPETIESWPITGSAYPWGNTVYLSGLGTAEEPYQFSDALVNKFLNGTLFLIDCHVEFVLPGVDTGAPFHLYSRRSSINVKFTNARDNSLTPSITCDFVADTTLSMDSPGTVLVSVSGTLTRSTLSGGFTVGGGCEISRTTFNGCHVCITGLPYYGVNVYNGCNGYYIDFDGLHTLS